MKQKTEKQLRREEEQRRNLAEREGKTFYTSCTCTGMCSVLRVTFDPDWEGGELMFERFINYTHPYGWKEKLMYMWRMLRGRTIYDNEIFVSRDECNAMIEWMTKMLEEPEKQSTCDTIQKEKLEIK